MLQISEKDQSTCLTGNPIDDCWKCDPDWANNRQRLADCAIGFGQYALGGKNGEYYIVTDSSDDDAVNPKPGTLRYAVIQEEPLWIVFPSNMLIRLSQELIFNSFKTLDGRGANVHIVGGGCITLQYITNVIIHNIHIHHCVPSGKILLILPFFFFFFFLIFFLEQMLVLVHTPINHNTENLVVIHNSYYNFIFHKIIEKRKK